MPIVALLITLVVLFMYQGEKIVELPLVIGMITIPIFVNIIAVFIIIYFIARLIKLGYEDAHQQP